MYVKFKNGNEKLVNNNRIHGLKYVESKETWFLKIGFMYKSVDKSWALGNKERVEDVIKKLDIFDWEE